MNIEIIKMLSAKVANKTLTIEEVRKIYPDYEKNVELVDLLKTEEVELYLQSLETDQVKRYIELTRPTTKGHGGPKEAMPCKLCGHDSHPIKWVTAKINGIDNWVGTLTEKCEKFETERFQVPVGTKPSGYSHLPMSQGQINGRLKSEK